MIDASGAANLHGSEDAMLRDMVDRLGQAGHAARAACADSWGAADAFARFSAAPSLVVSHGSTSDLVLDLPIAALRLPPDNLDGLRVLGFDTIRDLVATPRAPLTLRFGPELGRRID